jgi:hypothetical protein
MLVSDAIASVRRGTLHDVDTQVLDTDDLLPRVSQEYRRLRRWLCAHCPSLCEATVSGIAVAASTITKATSLPTFESVVLVRKLVGSIYYPIGTTTRYNTISTSSTVGAGTYEVTYLTGAPASIVVGTTLDLPAGLEDVLIERVSAWVRLRQPGEEGLAGHHDRRADERLAEITGLLKGRGGRHGNGGLRRESEGSLVWHETPNTIEICARYAP